MENHLDKKVDNETNTGISYSGLQGLGFIKIKGPS